ncbi:MAG: ComF family protein [Alphaproteobacteria bacterium]|nr:ComF family protein [Alphaproteobacteria bacterium]
MAGRAAVIARVRSVGLALPGWALRQLVDFALPPRCPGCGLIVSQPHSFCLECWQSLVWLGEPCCARCGLPFEYGNPADTVECGACLADPPRFERLRAAVAYGEVARKVALKLKYGGRPGVAETLARFMARHLPGVGDGTESILLVPVPLHRWRIWKRGYNQAALIAIALSRRSGIAVDVDLLRRTRQTPPLRGMSRRERWLAVRGAFAVRGGGRPALAGKTVILVDDVYTSGATVDACARALKRAGAAQVRVICWARVVAGAEQGAIVRRGATP